MLSTGYQAADVIPPLRTALSGLGLDSVKISCCEGQGWSYSRDLLAEVQDAGAENALDLITTHTYKGMPATPDEPLNTTLPVWVTEISPIMDRLGMTQTWYRNHSENEGLRHAVNIHEALTTGNVSAYIYWIGVGQSRAEAPFIWAPNLTPNVSREDMWRPNPQPVKVPEGTLPYAIGSTYWASAQFSRFVRPGARRIEVTQEHEIGNYTRLLTSAYRNEDGGIVLQIVNDGNEVVTLDVAMADGSPRSLCTIRTYVTDEVRRLERVDTGHLGGGNGFGGASWKRSLTTYTA